MVPQSPKFRVGAVSFLNTVPLAWGMLHGPQRSEVDLSFSVPSTCAAQVESGALDVGLVPVAEIARQNLEIVPGVGITCFGPVRSILLFSKVPWRDVRTLAADANSRTSVQLARVILRERFSAGPVVRRHQPDLPAMLATNDAALVIGDPALALQPGQLPYEWLDLGEEWFRLTDLPMVFAAWACKPGLPLNQLARLTTGSYHYGQAHLQQIVVAESARHGVTPEVAQRYLTEHIHFELGPKELEGLATFFRLAGLVHDYSTTSA